MLNKKGMHVVAMEKVVTMMKKNLNKMNRQFRISPETVSHLNEMYNYYDSIRDTRSISAIAEKAIDEYYKVFKANKDKDV